MVRSLENWTEDLKGKIVFLTVFRAEERETSDLLIKTEGDHVLEKRVQQRFTSLPTTTNKTHKTQ